MERDINVVIGTIRGNIDNPARFLNGQCYKFFQVLRTLFPESEAWSDCDHVITRIGNKFYDITGEVEFGDHLPIDSLERKRYNGLEQND